MARAIWCRTRRSRVTRVDQDISAHSITCVNSLIVIQERRSNDLHIFNNGELLRKFQGIPDSKEKTDGDDASGLNEDVLEVKPVFSNIVFLWQCSSNSVALMNIGNLDNQLIVDNFWEDAETVNLGLIPLTLVMNIKPEKILGLAKFDGSKYILRTFEIEKKKIRTFEFGMSAKELGLGESQFSVVSIDKSQRTNLFFTAFNFNRQSPRIVQTKITKDGLQSVSSISIEAQNFKQINKISSFQIGKHEYILASGTNSLVLLVSKDKVISTLHIFVDLVAGEIVDSCICRNKFFSVSPGYPFIVEVTANNKVDEKELQEFQKHYHSEEMKDEIHYERYNISKLEMANNKFNRLDVTKKGDVLYAIGKGIMAITGLNSSKPIKSEVFFESNF